MFKRTVTDRDTQLTTTQQRPVRGFKNATLLPDGCCCLSNKGNETLFRINISPPLNNDLWIGRGGPKPWPPRSPDLTPMGFFPMGPHSSPDLRTSRQLILKRISFPFNSLNDELNPICHLLTSGAHHILHLSRIRVKLLCYRLCIEVGGRRAELLL
jgi:hypothetical protein